VKRVLEGRVTSAISIKEILFRGAQLRINVVNTREAAAVSARKPGSITLFDSYGRLGKTLLIADRENAEIMAEFLGLTSEHLVGDHQLLGFLRSSAVDQICYIVPSQAVNLFHQMSGISDTAVELSVLAAVNQ